MFFMLALLSACDYEAEMLPKMFPLIKTEYADAGRDDVLFLGSILNEGTSPIRYYGFVWGIQENPKLSNHYYLYSGKPTDSYFSYTNKDGLTATDYWFRAVVITDSTVVYGQSVRFHNKFNSQQMVYGFNPAFGYAGDLVTISGKNLQLDGVQLSVYFGEVKVEIDSVNNTQLFVKVPNTQVYKKVKISVLYPIEKSRQNIGDFELFPIETK